MSSQFTRRDFLKLAALAPVALAPLAKMEFPSPITGSVHHDADSRLSNVIILVFDTLTAKNMSLHGYERATTPHIARFADRATVYHNHYSSGNFTSPGTASIFTGAYPWAHRAFNLHGTIAGNFQNNNIFKLLPAGMHKVAYTHNLLVTSFLSQFQDSLDVFKPTRELSLADEQYSDRLFPSDYSTSFWSEGVILRGGGAKPSSLFLSMLYKLARLGSKRSLVKEYGHLFPRGLPNLNDIYFVLEEAVNWIMEQMILMPQPYFGYFHLLPPHEPYTTRRDFVDIFQDTYTPLVKPKHAFSEGHTNKFLNQQRREYDEYIAYTDAEFGRLFDFLDQSGAMDNTYIVLTSDHGELFERGIRGHVTQTMYEPLIRVPLLISKPGQRRREDVTVSTSCVDLMPTLLHLSGQEIPGWCEGRLLPGMGAESIDTDRNIYAMEAKSNAKYRPLTKGTYVLVKGNYKLIYYLSSKSQERENELYDLSADPEEMVNIYRSRQAVAAQLQNELESKLHQVNEPYVPR